MATRGVAVAICTCLLSIPALAQAVAPAEGAGMGWSEREPFVWVRPPTEDPEANGLTDIDYIGLGLRDGAFAAEPTAGGIMAIRWARTGPGEETAGQWAPPLDADLVLSIFADIPQADRERLCAGDVVEAWVSARKLPAGAAPAVLADAPGDGRLPCTLELYCLPTVAVYRSDTDLHPELRLELYRRGSGKWQRTRYMRLRREGTPADRGSVVDAVMGTGALAPLTDVNGLTVSELLTRVSAAARAEFTCDPSWAEARVVASGPEVPLGAVLDAVMVSAWLVPTRTPEASGVYLAYDYGAGPGRPERRAQIVSDRRAMVAATERAFEVVGPVLERHSWDGLPVPVESFVCCAEWAQADRPAPPRPPNRSYA